MMTNELRPSACPFCDSINLEVCATFEADRKVAHFVKCLSCDAHGPLFDQTGLCETNEAAVTAWNTRGPMLTALGGWITERAAKEMLKGPIASGGISISHVKTSTRPIAVYLKERPFHDK